MGFWVFFCVRAAAATRGQYLISLEQGWLDDPVVIL